MEARLRSNTILRVMFFAALFVAPKGSLINPTWAATPDGEARRWDLSTLKGRDLISSEPISLQVKSGSPTVVVFLSAKCPCSNSHVELLNQLKREFPSFGFVGVHSNQNEDLDLSRSYFNKDRFTFAVVHDEGTKIADALGALKTPHVFVFDEKGSLKYQGGISNSSDVNKATQIFLRKALASLKKGEDPDPSEIQALGCYISR